jgi:hypothetical protein
MRVETQIGGVKGKTGNHVRPEGCIGVRSCVNELVDGVGYKQPTHAVSAKNYLDTTRPTVSSLLLHSKGSEPVGKAFDGFVLHYRHYESGTNGTRTY